MRSSSIPSVCPLRGPWTRSVIRTGRMLSGHSTGTAHLWRPLSLFVYSSPSQHWCIRGRRAKPAPGFSPLSSLVVYVSVEPSFFLIYRLTRTHQTLILCFFFFIVESIGYGSRAASASAEPGCWTLIPYILQTIFILVAPALFGASIYIILGRVVRLTQGEQHTVIPIKWISKTFIMGDIACFSLQSAGKTRNRTLFWPGCLRGTLSYHRSFLVCRRPRQQSPIRHRALRRYCWPCSTTYVVRLLCHSGFHFPPSFTAEAYYPLLAARG